MPVESVFFAAPHASAGVAKYLSGRLLALDPILRERRQVFAILYFAFSASEIPFTNRCKVAAKFVDSVARYGFNRYLHFQVARACEGENDLDTLFAGLRFLSGIENPGELRRNRVDSL